MVSTEEFEKAQEILGRKMAQRKRDHVFVFGGMLRCGNCGCQIVASQKTKNYKGTGRTVSYTYYHCTNGKGGCSKHGIPEQEVTDSFREAFDSIKIPPAFAGWALEESVTLAEHEGLAVAASGVSITNDISKKERELDRIHRMRINEEISAPEYRELKEAVGAELERLQSSKFETSTREERILRLIKEKLLLAAAAEGYPTQEIAKQRGMGLGLGHTHYLTLGKLRISMHPILQKIAGFGPLRDGSETPKSGDLLPRNAIWYDLIRDIRTLAERELLEQPFRKPLPNRRKAAPILWPDERIEL